MEQIGDCFTHTSNTNFVSETKPLISDNADQSDDNNWDHSGDRYNSQAVAASDRSGGGGSIVERRAARSGCSAGGFRICTARFRQTDSPICSPGVRSPYITIPAGLSPTALLDSPIMLPNSPVDPSPTTGTFLPSPYSHHGIMLDTVTAPAGGDRESDDSVLFNFQHLASPTSVAGILSSEGKPEEETDQMGFSETVVMNDGSMEQSVDEKISSTMIADMNSLASQHQRSDKTSDPIPQHQLVKEELGSPMEVDQKGTYSLMDFSRTSEDGYNWRKYGQKQVKGSEFPRSYYKCTHQTCQVKKIVERAPDGQVTEIIYKGNHNHQKPQLNRRSMNGLSLPCKKETEEIGEGNGVWRNIQLGSKDSNFCSPLRNDGFASILNADISAKAIGVSEFAVTPEQPFTFACNDNGATNNADEEESEAKRRKTESFLAETNVSLHSAREPKVVVEIESEVDVLDDGYRWRKYGQKVVKGNPNPRSYYKCTSPGCVVRKHVERACHNIKFVITTYEGKHNHEVPAARNSHSYGGGLATQAAAASSQPRNTSKPNSQVADFRLNFQGKPEIGNNPFTTRPCLPRNFGSDIKFGAATPMIFPPSSQNNSMAYGKFLLNPTTYNVMNKPPLSSVAPHFGIPSSSSSSPWTFPRSVRRIPGGFSLTTNKNNNQSFLGGQQFCNNGAWLLKPKEEQIDDNLYNTHLPSSADHLNLSSSSSCSSSSSAYCEVMQSFKP